jgi:radical SAM protein with 4Fe4S-binding SPASM domain
MEQERTADEWIDMAKQVAKAGTVGLLITGGEPLFRKDFAQIWEGIYRIGFQIQLYTNATLVTPEILALFRKYPPHRIGISIYGASESTYQKVCGNGDAYRQAMKGISRLRTLPSILDFRTTIIKDNLDDIDEMEEWVRQNFGEDHSLTHTKMVIKPVRGGCSEALSCRLDPEENIKLFLSRHIRLIEKIIGHEKFDSQKIRLSIQKNASSSEGASNISLFGCDAGMRAYAISWDGKLLGCQVMGGCYTEPYLTGFKAAWGNFPAMVTPMTIDPLCMECEIKEFCLSCCATRYAETGNPVGCFDYACNNTIRLTKFVNEERDENNEKAIPESICPF